jgi:hypothetical protein
MSCLPDRPLDIAGERGASDLLGLAPGAFGGSTIESAVADEGELARAGPGALVNDAADRLRERRMAKAIENDLGDGSAPLERLVAGFVIDGLG